MLVQIDGSPHAWLQERGPRSSLLAAIDDATGKILAAVFREQEDRVGYFLLVQQLVARYGCPLAFYHDRHEIFPKRQAVQETDSLEEQLAGRAAPSQFGRLLEELEITSIAARSPQANDLAAYCTLSAWLACFWIFVSTDLWGVLIGRREDRNPMIIGAIHGDQSCPSPIHDGLSAHSVGLRSFIGRQQAAFA